MRRRKPSFKELVIDNKLAIKRDHKELERIEEKIEDKYRKKLLYT